MIHNPSHSRNDAIDALTGTAALLGRSRISYLSSRLFAEPPPGPIETASVITLNPPLSAELIRIANNVQYGAGIPVLNVEAATVRLGADRTRSLALAFEVTQTLYSTLGETIDFGDFWRRGLVRGCIARALAMNADRRIAGEAFLVGLLQDIGAAVIASAEPNAYSTLNERSDGCPLQMAVLEWQSFNLNHIHTGLRLLRQWQAPAAIVDAVGRHHTNPPLSPAMSPAMRLWQIGYVAGAMPIGPSRTSAPTQPLLLRLLRSAFGIQAGGVSALMDQSAEEYRDVEGLFSRYFTVPANGTDLFSAAANLAMDASRPLDVAPAAHPIRVREIAPLPIGSTNL